MNDKLRTLVHDIDDARHDERVCRSCLVDVLASTLQEVLAEIGTDANRHGSSAWPAPQAH